MSEAVPPMSLSEDTTSLGSSTSATGTPKSQLRLLPRLRLPPEAAGIVSPEEASESATSTPAALAVERTFKYHRPPGWELWSVNLRPAARNAESGGKAKSSESTVVVAVSVLVLGLFVAFADVFFSNAFKGILFACGLRQEWLFGLHR